MEPFDLNIGNGTLPSFSFVDFLNENTGIEDLHLSVTDLLVEYSREEEKRKQYQSLAKRRMPYLENRHIDPTETRPTIAGIHRTKRGGICFNLRDYTKDYYQIKRTQKSKNWLPGIPINFLPINFRELASAGPNQLPSK